MPKSSAELPYPRSLSGTSVENLPPACVPARAIIKGKYVELVPLQANLHASDLYQAGHSGEQSSKIWAYMAYGPWESVDQYAKALRAQSGDHDIIYYAIRSLETGKFEGQASYLNIHAQMGTIEIGHIWFGAKLARTRAASEALTVLIAHAMDDLGYRRIEWKCNALNEKSRQAARRLGFKFEGVFFNHLIFKGKNRDTAWYSIVDYEWPQVKKVLSRWLSEDNFDDHGLAKTSLYSEMMKRQ